MNKNACYTYFAIKGDFKTQDISNKLGLIPFKEWNIGDYRKNGTKFEFALWEYGGCDEYDVEVENQMRKTIENLIPLKKELLEIKNKYNAYLVLEVVPTIYIGESTPCLSPTRDIIKFLYETGSEIDIDLYINDYLE